MLVFLVTLTLTSVSLCGTSSPSLPECGEFEEPSECGLLYAQPHDPAIDLYSKCRRCKCIDNYVRDSYGDCVPIPPAIACGQNEEASYCKKVCPPLSCDWDPTKYACKAGPCQAGCNCVYGHLKDKNGDCVPKDECPPHTGLVCGENEVSVECRIICPPQACKSSYTDYFCDPNPICEPGCDCIEDHLRDNNGVCVLNNDCPPPPIVPVCSEFEELSECGLLYSQPHDPALDLYLECQPCKCMDNYIRDSYGECVPLPPLIACGENEEASYCKKVCPPQRCDWDPEEQPCEPGPCKPGCNCVNGFLRNECGKCIPQDQCTITDPDDYEDVDVIILINLPRNMPHRPSRRIISTIPCNVTTGEAPCIYDQCTPTCSIPNPPNCPQISAGATNRCNCADGYILSEEGGQCITIQECQSRNTCRQNETFVYCSFDCPSNNCPENDNRAKVACGVPYHCPPGCACQPNYRRISDNDDRCILASDCPPVNCTRQNEEWNSCPSPCFTDRCQDLDRTPRECPISGSYCEPQCVCRESYCRNDSNICIPVSDYRNSRCRENETFVSCVFDCPTLNCPQNDDRVMVACDPAYPCPSGCACKANHKRISYNDNRCILASDCPPVNCTRPYEKWDSCPPPCFNDRCQDPDLIPEECPITVPYCQPQCVCQENYCRDYDSDLCVPDFDLISAE